MTAARTFDGNDHCVLAAVSRLSPVTSWRHVRYQETRRNNMSINSKQKEPNAVYQPQGLTVTRALWLIVLLLTSPLWIGVIYGLLRGILNWF